ncbi:hypothetical protein BSNK01_31040 [Bacillaceae bacterium]
MPLYSFKEIWTPLRIVRIRIYREVHDGTIWIKMGNRPRRRLFS